VEKLKSMVVIKRCGKDKSLMKKKILISTV